MGLGSGPCSLLRINQLGLGLPEKNAVCVSEQIKGKKNLCGASSLDALSMCLFA